MDHIPAYHDLCMDVGKKTELSIQDTPGGPVEHLTAWPLAFYQAAESPLVAEVFLLLQECETGPVFAGIIASDPAFEPAVERAMSAGSVGDPNLFTRMADLVYHAIAQSEGSLLARGRSFLWSEIFDGTQKKAPGLSER